MTSIRAPGDSLNLIGIDMATEDQRIGIAMGRSSSEGRPTLLDAFTCSREKPAVKHVAQWIRQHGQPVILAIDAPLGWPTSMGTHLVSHTAGGALPCEPNRLFRRDTDRFIKQRVGLNALDVGADRIARTALAALRLLEDLRTELGVPLPLAWDANDGITVAAIEVYPASTLKVLELPFQGYKLPPAIEKRRSMIARLRRFLDFPESARSAIEAQPDALDAAVCIIAANDFLNGQCAGPEDFETARKEGWIWVRDNVHFTGERTN